ncbi:unnamed protein product [Amoebophrya sp. A25]|nr:unnamed protein product [Amoebophrya sp. A25]|eukprot:GSA25T00016833001.1
MRIMMCVVIMSYEDLFNKIVPGWVILRHVSKEQLSIHRHMTLKIGIPSGGLCDSAGRWSSRLVMSLLKWYT